jgi:hypothetical protein
VIQLKEPESLTMLPFLAISDPTLVTILSPLGSHVGNSMGTTFSTTHPGRSTIQDATKYGDSRGKRNTDSSIIEGWSGNVRVGMSWNEPE